MRRHNHRKLILDAVFSPVYRQFNICVQLGFVSRIAYTEDFEHSTLSNAHAEFVLRSLENRFSDYAVGPVDTALILLIIC